MCAMSCERLLVTIVKTKNKKVQIWCHFLSNLDR